MKHILFEPSQTFRKLNFCPFCCNKLYINYAGITVYFEGDFFTLTTCCKILCTFSHSYDQSFFQKFSKFISKYQITTTNTEGLILFLKIAYDSLAEIDDWNYISEIVFGFLENETTIYEGFPQFESEEEFWSKEKYENFTILETLCNCEDPKHERYYTLNV